MRKCVLKRYVSNSDVQMPIHVANPSSDSGRKGRLRDTPGMQFTSDTLWTWQSPRQ